MKKTLSELVTALYCPSVMSLLMLFHINICILVMGLLFCLARRYIHTDNNQECLIMIAQFDIDVLYPNHPQLEFIFFSALLFFFFSSLPFESSRIPAVSRVTHCNTGVCPLVRYYTVFVAKEMAG